jgi:hypothetical protein
MQSDADENDAQKLERMRAERQRDDAEAAQRAAAIERANQVS